MISQALTNQTARQLLGKAFPGKTITSCELLFGGLINTNLKISFDSSNEPIVLRIYRDGANACTKEMAMETLKLSKAF